MEELKVTAWSILVRAWHDNSLGDMEMAAMILFYCDLFMEPYEGVINELNERYS